MAYILTSGQVLYLNISSNSGLRRSVFLRPAWSSRGIDTSFPDIGTRYATLSSTIPGKVEAVGVLLRVSMNTSSPDS